MRETLVTALRLSGEKLLEYFNRPLETKQKESISSVVTRADLDSDLIITELIKQKFPQHNLISEESGYVDNQSEYTWVIDPLDGTSNFASGLPWFGILISLFKKNTPVMGGAYLPVSDVLYFAEKEGGAFRNYEPLKMDQKKIEDSLIAFSVDYTEDDAFLEKGISIFRYIIKNSRNIRSTNSLLDFINVAEGKFGGCINLFTKIWDISALGLIISEAGGVMNDITGGKIDFQIGKDIVNRNFAVVAAVPGVIGSLNEVLSRTF